MRNSFDKSLYGLSKVLCVGALCMSVGSALANEVSVQAMVEVASGEVGEPTMLKVRVMGAQNAEIPELSISGANVRYQGPLREFSIENGTQRVSVTHHFVVVPQKEGKLEIGPIGVIVGGKKYETNPISLPVVAKGQELPEEKYMGAFVQVTLNSSRDTVYVGEAVPTEFQLFVPEGIRWQEGRNYGEPFMALESDTFLQKRTTAPVSSRATKDGRGYDVRIVRNILTAIRSGELPLGNVEFRTKMLKISKKAQQNPVRNIFGEPVQQGQVIDVVIPFNDGKVRVLDLPEQGKPASFRGAIGKFQMVVTNTQKKVKAGEPVTLQVQVQGMGNWDQVETPTLVNSDGWRVYPPESQFNAGDELGYRGTKTFRIPVVAEVKKKETPVLEFVFFDPETGKYQVQRSKAEALEIEGKLPEQKVVTEDTEKVEQQPGVAKAEGPKVERTTWRSSPMFLGIQAGLGGVLLLWGLYRWNVARRQRMGVGPQLRKEANRLLAKLSEVKDDAEFLKGATRVLQLRCAADVGLSPDVIGIQEIKGWINGDDNLVSEIEWLFANDAACRYGGGAIIKDLGNEGRTRVVRIVERSKK